MRTNYWKGALSLPLGLVLLGGLSGCIDEGALYPDQPAWSQSNDPALGFLGYSDPATKTPTCWSCHPGLQAGWQETAHADAWATLQNSGHAADYCEPCHTVSSLGNASTNPDAGFAATREQRYQDVQCESCHGPGLLHMSNPAATQPRASFEAGTDLENGCGECHEGTHHPFVEQWALSAHGAGPNTEYASGVSESCMACHEGQRALEVTFGVDADYLEKGDGELRTITCVVCHDPHGSPYSAQLRASVDIPTEDHLCMRCHARTGTPWSSHGPHAAQGLLLFGENVGYVPPGFSFPDKENRNNHGPRNNPRLCTTCHVSRMTVTDDSGNFLLESVGHSFEAVSCLDSEGLPVPGGDCSPSERTFVSCATVGCHGSESGARDAYIRIRGRLNALLDQLWLDTDGDHVMEATDGGLLPRVIGKGFESDLDPTDPTINPAKGALWNAMLAWTHDRPQWSDGEVAGGHFSSHPNSGNGVHNPHLLEALLLASLKDVRDSYGLQPASGEDLSGLASGGVDLPNGGEK
jgi:predicted CXXCH cytochrome family protein